jgi:glycosyltransferase involved in cell wall biosynthesis
LWLDRSRKNYYDKRKLFNAVEKLIIVTPSNWLEKLVHQSFLSQKKCVTINNGIDIDVFSYRKSMFRQENGIKNSDKIILGVASSWAPRKGLNDFIQLRKLLGREYVIILVGLKSRVLRKMPSGIVGIEKTDNTSQLAEIYSSADVFVNPTYEDNFPTVNIEALACGTPVITYDTGGSGECISSATGRIVIQGDIEGIAEAIKDMTTLEKNIEECKKQAKKFTKEACYEKYIRLYEEMLK